MTILVTGAAGFIGYHACLRLLEGGHDVLGVDSLNAYYDVQLKTDRLAQLTPHKRFSFETVDLSDASALDAAVARHTITHILHLAAQAGVRHSLKNPRSYIQANVMAHLNILELARHSGTVEHIVYASSSSVYGDRETGPFNETDDVRSPASLYAATKLSGELMAESYARLYKISQTGLRFFTVYGPWGRPDMAYFLFTDKIFNNQPITLFAPEQMKRDFTYIDDIVAILPKILQSPPAAGHALYNLGNSKPNLLMHLVKAVETACGKPAEKVILGKQKGDVSATYANIDAARADFGFDPKTDLNTGIARFVDWYRDYYAV